MILPDVSVLQATAPNRARASLPARMLERVVDDDWKSKFEMMKRHYLSAEFRDTYVVFQWARLDSTTKYSLALLCIFVVSVFSTVIIKVLHQFEKEVLARIAAFKLNPHRVKRVSPLFLVGAATAFTARMCLSYIIILALLTMNVWILVAVCMGHFVGWVLFSALGVTYYPTTSNNNNNNNSKNSNANRSSKRASQYGVEDNNEHDDGDNNKQHEKKKRKSLDTDSDSDDGSV